MMTTTDDPTHLVLDEATLAAGIDQTSAEWRLAYAMASADHAGRGVLEQTARRAAVRDARRRHRHGTLRFAGLLLTLAATATLTTVVMFRVLYLVLS